MADPHQKTDAERALLTEQMNAELAEWRRFHLTEIDPAPSVSTAAEGVAVPDHPHSPGRTVDDLQSHGPSPTGLGSTRDDWLRPARGCLNGILFSLPFWAAAAIGAWAAWRWWVG